MPAADPEALAAALLTLADHAARLADLDARQHAAAGHLAALTALADGMRTALDDQAEILAGLTALTGQVTGLAARIDQIAPAESEDDDAGPRVHRPAPAPRLWRPDGPDRDQALARLRAWVDQVYRPGYGQLAAALGPCWEQHPLALYTLDWLSELWQVLYLQPRRDAATLAGQAEWQTRLLEAAAGQLARETARCGHARPGARSQP